MCSNKHQKLKNNHFVCDSMSNMSNSKVSKTAKILINWHRTSVRSLNCHLPSELISLIVLFVGNGFHFVSKDSNQPEIPLYDNITYSNDDKTVTITKSVRPVFGSVVWTKNELKKPLYIS